MFGTGNFVNCILDALKTKGFGEKRAQEVIDRFHGIRESLTKQGVVADADAYAMNQVMQELAEATREKNRLRSADLFKAAQRQQRFVQFDKNDAIFRDTNANVDPGTIAKSFLEADPRAKGLNYNGLRDAISGRLWSMMHDVVEKAGKGAFGRQLGTAHLPNIVRELFGNDTGDATAKALADAWRKTTDTAVDMFNQAGGSMRKLEGWNMPQMQSTAKLLKEGKDAWQRFHFDNLAWDRMRWPDGSPIKPEDRARVLDSVWDTLSTNGANKIKPEALGGKGSALGKAMDEHRFLIYKDGDVWLQAHERFSDGNVFDVMAGHLEHVAHNIALIQLFGSNPEMGAQQIKAAAMKQAADIARAGGPADIVVRTAATLKNKFDPMWELITKKNAMDPESTMGHLVTSTSQILTSAQLGSAVLTASGGDFATRAIVRAFNGMGFNPFNGIDTYLKTALTDAKFMRDIATQSGFVMDEAISSTYAASRFTGFNTYSNAITRHISEGVMRASFMSGHTRAARWTSQMEFLGMMARDAGKALDELPYAKVFERYGIGAREWDAMRAVPTWSPREGVSFLRPIDAIAHHGGEAGTALYNRFQTMILEEARMMVPESTIEGTAMLKGTTRPDTLAGAVLHSFSMYKNFPASMMMVYGRLAMSSSEKSGRIGLVAGLGAGLTIMGALSYQMKELSKGRDPVPMNTAAFWGKSFLTGGAMGIWGDFLFQGTTGYGNSVAETVGGPIAGLVNDAHKAAFGDLFQWAGSADEKPLKLPAQLVEMAKRYTPGSSLWYARLGLEREVFDRLSVLADPKAYKAMNNRVKKQQKDVGNGYWFAPGTTSPDRAPSFTGAFGQ